MKRALRLILALALVALGAVGLAQAQPQSGIVRPTQEPSTSSVQLGAQLYAGNCLSCHGISGAGVNPSLRGAGDITAEGPALKGVGALAADFYLRTGYMPLRSVHDEPERERVLFSEPEIRSLVAYVASLGSGPSIPQPQPRQGSVGEGLNLFTEHCAGCHQVVAQGGFVTGARVPPLQDSNATQIAEAVRVGPYLMPRFSPSAISDSQLNSIVAYVLSTRHPADRGGWGIGNLGPVPEGVVTWLIAAVALVAFCVLLGERLRS
jgi:ubiquinol-cytochrome c reductase cytochrome c subunit